MSNPDAQNQDGMPERSVVDQVQDIYASRFGALTRRDGALEYAKWAVADKVRPHVFAAAMDKLAESWGDRYGKPKLPDVKKAYYARVRLLQDSRMDDSKPCPRCDNDGFVWCAMGREQWSNHMHPIPRKQPEWYPALGVFVQPCDCHAGKIRNAKSFRYSEATLHALNRDCAFAFNSRSLAEDLRIQCEAMNQAERQGPVSLSAAEQATADRWIEDVARIVGALEGFGTVFGQLGAVTDWFRYLGFIADNDSLDATPATVRDRARANPRGFLTALRAFLADRRGGEAAHLADILFSGATPAFSKPARRREDPTPDPKKTRERNDTTRHVADVAPRKA